MSPIARVLGLALPACGAAGAGGVALPPADLATLRRSGKPNSALAAPAGFRPAAGRDAEITTRRYPVPAATLLAALRRVAAGRARCYDLPNPGAPPGRADWVARSAVCNWPDIISAQATDDPAAGTAPASTLILHSHSVYGYSDFGVNAARVRAWLAALDDALASDPAGH